MATYFNDFSSIDTSNIKPFVRENVNSIYENRGMIGLEAYFGRTPIVLTTIEAYDKIIDLLPTKGKIDAQSGKAIKDILKKLGEDLAIEFNVESVTIGLDSDDNACAYPLIIGKRKDTKNITKIKETATGYRFTQSEGVHFILIIGIPKFLGEHVTGEHVTAVTYHELGHQFQLCEDMNAVRHNINVYKLRALTDHLVTFIRGVIISLNPNLIINLFMVLIDFLRLDKLFGKMKLKYDRKGLADEVKEGTNEVLKKSIKTPRKSIGESITNYIHQLITTIPLIGVVYGVTVDSRINKGVIGFPYTSLRRKHEEFADRFATKYGLGSILTESFKEDISSLNNGTNALKTLNKIPGYRALAQLNALFVTTCTVAACGYPSDRVRILLTYKAILKEINDPNIPPHLKASAIEELRLIKEVYDEYINTKTQKEHKQYARAFVYSISRFFLRIKVPQVLKETNGDPEKLHKVVTVENATTIKEKPNFMFMKLFNCVKESFGDTFGNKSISTETLNMFESIECSVEEVSIATCHNDELSKVSRFPIFDI